MKPMNSIMKPMNSNKRPMGFLGWWMLSTCLWNFMCEKKLKKRGIGF